MFAKLSIQKKLILGLTGSLILTIGISSAVGIWLIGDRLLERSAREELPVNVTAIRNDLLKVIAGPLAQSRAMAVNPALLQWEAAGTPPEQLAAWQAYAGKLKDVAQASSVYWVSESSGRYHTDKGLDRTLSRDAAADGWFYGFLAAGKQLSLDLDVDKSNNVPNLFINVVFQTEGGQRGITGLGLAVDSLTSLIKNYRIAQTGHVFLVRPDGTVLLHGDPTITSQRTKVSSLAGWSEADLLPLLKGEAQASSSRESDQGRMMVASSFVPELNLYVFAEVPEAEVAGPIRSTLWWVTIATGLGSVLVAAVLVTLFSRAIAGPVQRASSLLGEIASGEGDLTREMVVETQDETGELAMNFNRFVGTLSGMVRSIRQSTETINVASTEVAVGNQDLSSRTEQAASALQETAAAMAQITNSVQHSATVAQEARELAGSAMQTAQISGVAMDDVVHTMAEISASSTKIRDIIGVIDGIAFQTNILALNAAVEAARAGEQGRGFAVVASEVRALAQRSGEAAKEIRSLISASSEMVEAGSVNVAKAGDSLRNLVGSVDRVNSLIADLSQAATQQGEGIGQIHQAIAQLDGMTQQNAALVEQSTAAAESLKQQAISLSESVAAFKVRS
jgi:methyl-accepting chemotaxis protein